MKHCEICGPLNNGTHGDRCFYGTAVDEERLAKWRDDRPEHCKETRPTVSTVVACASDTTAIEKSGAYGTYQLRIDHVLTFHGKAFMPALVLNERWCGNGNSYKTYDEAIRTGAVDLFETVKRNNRECAEFDAQQAEIAERRKAQGK